jgi:hypothetical protein
MLSAGSQVGIILGVVVLLCVPTTIWAQDAQSQDPVAVTASPDVAGELAEIAPGQVVVTYENAQLTIKAQSALLIDVLHEVCNQIGTELDAAGVADETVLGVIGPGPAREVLASMLNGSPYDLATAARADDPNDLARLVVFPKSINPQASPTRDSEAQSPLTQSVAPPVDNSKPASSVKDEGMEPLIELFEQAEAELANLASSNSQEDGDASEDTFSKAVKAHQEEILWLFEVQIKAAATEGWNNTPQPVSPQSGASGPADPATTHRKR